MAYRKLFSEKFEDGVSSSSYSLQTIQVTKMSAENYSDTYSVKLGPFSEAILQYDTGEAKATVEALDTAVSLISMMPKKLVRFMRVEDNCGSGVTISIDRFGVNIGLTVNSAGDTISGTAMMDIFMTTKNSPLSGSHVPSNNSELKEFFVFNKLCQAALVALDSRMLRKSSKTGRLEWCKKQNN